MLRQCSGATGQVGEVGKTRPTRGTQRKRPQEETHHINPGEAGTREKERFGQELEGALPHSSVEQNPDVVDHSQLPQPNSLSTPKIHRPRTGSHNQLKNYHSPYSGLGFQGRNGNLLLVT